MKVSPAAQSRIGSINFKAGITDFYSDFDGTYFPFSQDKITAGEKNGRDARLLNEMQSMFASFIQNAKDKFTLTVTTGRSRNEMEYALKQIKSANVVFYMPDEYVLRDGMGRYRLHDSDNISLKCISGNAPQNKEAVIGIIKRADSSVSVIEPDANKYIKDFKGKTLEEEFLKLEKDKRHRYVSVVSEENGLIELVFSPNIDIEPFAIQLRKFYKGINEEKEVITITGDFNTYAPFWESETDDYRFLPANVIFIKPKINNKVPTKLDLPKEKVKYIVQNNTNDLVVVAGDGTNDKDMLNPLNYIDIYGINIDTSVEAKETLSNRGVLEAIKNLPLVCIVAGDGGDLKDILQIKQFLDNNGIYKIFNARDSKNDLLEKIKLGMLCYTDTNSEYKYSLGYELYEEILK